jgi:protein SCO1/2
MQPRRSFPRLAGLIAFLGLAFTATGADVLDRERVLQLSEAAIGREIPADYRFTDVDGRPFDLGSLRGAPVVVSLIYTSCYHTCPMVTEYLGKVVGMAREVLGEDSFTVLTIGFDAANDSPVRMRQFARERGISEPGWHFLSGNAETLAGLMADLGFSYVASAKGFDHLAQATVLDGEGRVYRQVYGERFPAPALVEPLKELVFRTPPQAGLLTSLTNEVKLFCTVFDPATGRYRFDYSLFVEIFAAVTCLSVVGWMIIRTWWRTS